MARVAEKSRQGDETPTQGWWEGLRLAYAPPASGSSDEESRDLLQTRLARFGKWTFILSASFYPLGVAVRARLGFAAGEPFLGGPTGAGTWHLLAAIVFLVTWLLTRSAIRTFRMLHTIDAVMTLASAFALMMVAMVNPPWARPDTFSTFIVSQILGFRAAVIPSSARRTATLATLAMLPVVAATYLYYGAHSATHTLPATMPTPAQLTLNAAIWATLVVAVATMLSRSVHGLRARVRAAMRLGQYTLDAMIGAGGMGVVYRASHALLRRPTAIKLLPPEKAGEQAVARFEREVQLTSQLTHPNTVSIYDFGRTAEGTFYYAMEYIEGFDLQQLVDAHGPQPPSRVAHLLAQICGALSEAHGIGLVHRDVKPANVMLCRRGGIPDVVKVLDFGLVRELHAGGDATISGASQLVGTPLYISPEAITDPPSLDAKSDLYAVGAVGYFLLTGVPPFKGATIVELCSHHMHTAPTPPSRLVPSIPAPMDSLILACLAKAPVSRPASALALARALTPLAEPWKHDSALGWWNERGASLLNRRAEELSAAAPSVRSATLTRAAGG